ncbi:MAG: hypothetical protein K8S15_09140 [Candidatus Aegiribacteria sp.]|nr:hypothetical protein [Candidatus Aegiribacteria sp.]
MKNIFIIITISLLAVVFTGCGSKFNVPFINTDETMQLTPNMTKEEVIVLCGDPLYVAFGDGDVTAWVYQIRSLNVGGSESTADAALSGARARLGMSDGSGLVKQGTGNDHGEVLPHLILFFDDDLLQFWATENGIADPGIFSSAWEAMLKPPFQE